MFPILLGKNNDLEKRVKTLEDSGGGPSGGGVLVVTVNGTVDGGTLDKTWQEIWNSGIAFIVTHDGENVNLIAYMTEIGIENGNYYIYSSNRFYYVTNSPDGYPASEE